MTVEIENTTKEKLKKIKQNYLRSTNEIEVNDLGAGSKKLKKRRKISDIAKSAASKGVYAQLLYQMIRHYKCERTLELGTSLGLGTFHLASGNLKGSITTIDGCHNTQMLAKEVGDKEGFTNINYICQDFKSFINGDHTIYDLIFVDGHHNGKALLDYIDMLIKNSHENTIFVLDDIRWSDDMLTAWNQLIADSRFYLSMDFFRMGIIIRRPEQAKEHFSIKIKNIISGMI